VKVTDTDVLIRIKASGICGSDIHRGFGGGAYHYPLIMGHECAGVVEDVPESSRCTPGDRVTVFPLLPCKQCVPCQTGDYAQCMQYDYFGSRRNGGFAEYLSVPEENLIPVPDHVEMLHAAMTEPCAVALHGVKKLNIRPGDTGAVFGAGPIGNMVAQWLRISGCRTVIVSDIDTQKLRIAADMGFVTVNPQETNPVEFIGSHTAGNGADRVVEACGLPLTFLQAVQATARFGEVVFMGNIQGEFVIGEQDFSTILRKELKIYGTWNSKMTPSGHDDWSTALKYLDKELQVAPLISHTPPLSEAVEMFRKVVNREEFVNKVIFTI
jgi:L-iditol 2-dehydrogenase